LSGFHWLFFGVLICWFSDFNYSAFKICTHHLYLTLYNYEYRYKSTNTDVRPFNFGVYPRKKVEYFFSSDVIGAC
ncbi:MAG: hypothetical protein AAF705_08440, partial [Bacteroidota bacterium]